MGQPWRDLRTATLCLAISALVLCWSHPSAAAAPRRLAPGEVTALEGLWEYRLEGTDTWSEVRVPGNLPFQGVDHDGVVWLRKSFELDDEWRTGDAALRLPMTSNAYEVYINDQVIGGRGRIGPQGELVEKDFRATVFRIPRERLGDKNTLSLRLRTFYGNGGIMAYGTLLGPEPMVRNEHWRRTARAAGLASLFAFAAFFHAVLFIGRRREVHQLWFALACAALSSVTAGVNTLGYLFSASPDFNAYLVFLPLLFLPALVIRFFASFFEQRNRLSEFVTRWLALTGTGVLVGSTLYNPLYPLFERVVLPLSLLTLFVTLGVSVWWTFKAQRSGSRGALIILFGIATYALSGGLELAWSLGLTRFSADSYLGFAVLIASMVTAVATRLAHLEERAERGEKDQLTGCLTRHALREPLRAVLSQHDRGEGELSCLLIDLDHFKKLNDTHGHNLGDRVLSAVGDTLRTAIRASDLVVRWGGEEFLVLLPNQGIAQAEEIAHRILLAVKRITFDELPELAVTASFGVASRAPFERFEVWLARADVALYQAKHAGRASVRIAATELGSHVGVAGAFVP